jgi:hypothetical protein
VGERASEFSILCWRRLWVGAVVAPHHTANTHCTLLISQYRMLRRREKLGPAPLRMTRGCGMRAHAARHRSRNKSSVARLVAYLVSLVGR